MQQGAASAHPEGYRKRVDKHLIDAFHLAAERNMFLLSILEREGLIGDGRQMGSIAQIVGEDPAVASRRFIETVEKFTTNMISSIKDLEEESEQMRQPHADAIQLLCDMAHMLACYDSTKGDTLRASLVKLSTDVPTEELISGMADAALSTMSEAVNYMITCVESTTSRSKSVRAPNFSAVSKLGKGVIKYCRKYAAKSTKMEKRLKQLRAITKIVQS